MAFAGFPYAVALRTGNPAAVASSFLLLFPFAFFTSAFVPPEALTQTLDLIAAWNPVTYVLAGLRALLTKGCAGDDLLISVIAIGCVALVSFTLALWALKWRVSRG